MTRPGPGLPHTPRYVRRSKRHYQRDSRCWAGENGGTAHDDWTTWCQEFCQLGETEEKSQYSLDAQQNNDNWGHQRVPAWKYVVHDLVLYVRLHMQVWSTSPLALHDVSPIRSLSVDTGR